MIVEHRSAGKNAKAGRLPTLIGLVLGSLAVGCSQAPSSADSAQRLAAVEDLRIGLSEGAEEYLFGTIRGIVQHDDGSVSILDTQVPVIRRYDADGTYLHDIGRGGQGPGEFSERVQGMQRLADDSIAVWDSGNQRITVFRPDGTLDRSFQAGSGGYYSASTLWVDQQDNFYVYAVDRPASLRQGEFPPRVYLKYSSAGELLGKIAVPDDDSETPGFVFATREGRLSNFSIQTLHALTSSGYLVVGHNADYGYEARADGETVLEVTHPWEPVPLEPGERAEWEAWVEYFTERARENDTEAPDYAPIPATKPAFMDLHGGVDGTIWVRRYAKARERTDRPPRAADDPRPSFNWWQPITLDAFDQEGMFRGTVELPNETWIVSLRRDRIWTVRPNEDEESVAVRYRLEGR